MGTEPRVVPLSDGLKRSTRTRLVESRVADSGRSCRRQSACR